MTYFSGPISPFRQIVMVVLATRRAFWSLEAEAKCYPSVWTNSLLVVVPTVGAIIQSLTNFDTNDLKPDCDVAVLILVQSQQPHGCFL